MKQHLCPGKILIMILLLVPFSVSADQGREIVDRAFRHMRGDTSFSVIEMTIKRPDFTRTMVMKSWTRGKSDAIFFIESPAKDAGNGTLKKGRNMWTYNPKVNRTIKLPPSMMSQAWMGSDFSNNDLSKTDSILEDYNHSITDISHNGDFKIYEITSIPHEDAAVVWGKLELAIREDGILLRETFFDEDNTPVKEMTTSEITMIGGRLFPKVWIMKKTDVYDKFTQMTYKKLSFDVPLPGNLFSLSSLKTRRR